MTFIFIFFYCRIYAICSCCDLADIVRQCLAAYLQHSLPPPPPPPLLRYTLLLWLLPLLPLSQPACCSFLGPKASHVINLFSFESRDFETNLLHHQVFTAVSSVSTAALSLSLLLFLLFELVLLVLVVFFFVFFCIVTDSCFRSQFFLDSVVSLWSSHHLI